MNEYVIVTTELVMRGNQFGWTKEEAELILSNWHVEGEVKRMNRIHFAHPVVKDE